jgi:hypothetical protein
MFILVSILSMVFIFILSLPPSSLSLPLPLSVSNHLEVFPAGHGDVCWLGDARRVPTFKIIPPAQAVLSKKQLEVD